MSKTIIAIIVVLVIIGAGYFFLNGPGEQAQAPVVEEENVSIPVEQGNDNEEINDSRTHVIVYTNEGYAPSNITIRKGDAITFENRGSKGMWPASAMHPTHEAYPVKSDSDCLGSSFDACEGIQPGGSWSFRFDEVGEWGFHDHLTPQFFGRITVTE